jgi:hypothetical protein
VSKVSVKYLIVALLMGAAAQAAFAQQPLETLAAFKQRLLNSHNAERARVGVPPLEWSEKLTADATLWADHLAKSSTFEHAPDRPENDLQGENLWMGSAAAFTPEEMVDGWIEERADYVPGVFPNVTRTANWEDVGHYTQLIWAHTRQVGCALASNQTDDFLVCRYATPGNWIGENPLGAGRAITLAKR